MFTGIVRERGTVAEVGGGPDGVRVVVAAPQTAADAGVGDSVSVDGCCLTAVEVRGRADRVRRRPGDAPAHLARAAPRRVTP